MSLIMILVDGQGEKRGIDFYMGSAKFIDSINNYSGIAADTATTLEKLGLDARNFRKVLKAYDLPYIRRLKEIDPKKIKEIDKITENSNDFYIEKKDIEFLKKFCEEAVKKINENKESLEKNVFPDCLNEYDHCRGFIRQLIAICSAAIKHGMRIHLII